MTNMFTGLKNVLECSRTVLHREDAQISWPRISQKRTVVSGEENSFSPCQMKLAATSKAMAS